VSISVATETVPEAVEATPIELAPSGAAERLIRTPDARLRVFISSTLGELAAEREAARTAVRTLRLTPVMFEIGARPHPPQELYRSYLAQSDVFVGIYWRSYGWVGPGADVSGLEDELRRSGDRPKLIYVKEPAEGRDDQLEALLERIRTDALASYKVFTTPGELAELILDDLALLVTERFHARGSAPAPLPTGTVTFLFSDVEDSTGLVEQLGQDYAAALDGYHDLVRRAVAARGGRVVDREGDGAFCVFTDAGEAADAAVAIQHELRERGGPVRVRIGLHSGTASLARSGYVGLDVHRAARISAAGHGGQIVVSSATSVLLDHVLGEDRRLRPLGSFALRGLSHTERLHQLEADGLPTRFPPLRARRAARVDLPAPLTSLVDRDREVAEVVGMLARPEVRLLTLTGPGGSGKTRLAIAVAERVAPSFPDGVRFVALGATDDPEAVPGVVADALGLPIEGDAWPSLANELADQELLLVLDNLEQVVAAAPEIARLLRRCPGLRVLATSRIVLRVSGEWEYAVPTLEVPADDRAATVASAPAGRLLIDRAREVRPGFEVTEDNAAALAGICRALDGLPLALELAAVQLRVLDPATLLDRLSASLATLRGGPGDRPARHRTVRATIDWSHELLAPEERMVFRRLAVLVGEFGLEAAEAVALEPDVDVAQVLATLAEKSLLVVRPDGGGGARLRLLATIREYGLERLEAAGEYELARDRHADWYLRLARRSGPSLVEAGQDHTLRVLAAEWANLQTAAEWLVARADAESVVDLVQSLWVFLWLEAHHTESRTWLDAIVDPTGEELSTRARGRRRWLLAGVSYERGDYADARIHLQAAIPLLAAEGDTRVVEWAEFLDALTLPALEDDRGPAAPRVEEALAGFRRTGDRWGEGWALLTSGILAAVDGDLGHAERQVRRCLTLAEQLGSPALQGQAHVQLGTVALGDQRLEQARTHLATAAEVFTDHPSREGSAYVLEAAALLAFSEGHAEGAMLAIGAAAAIREQASLHPWPAVAALVSQLHAAADAVEDDDLQRIRDDGRAMHWTRAVAAALGQPARRTLAGQEAATSPAA
jgi:predicted ATPase/class 3 adenylate cyclase